MRKTLVRIIAIIAVVVIVAVVALTASKLLVTRNEAPEETSNSTGTTENQNNGEDELKYKLEIYSQKVEEAKVSDHEKGYICPQCGKYYEETYNMSALSRLEEDFEHDMCGDQEYKELSSQFGEGYDECCFDHKLKIFIDFIDENLESFDGGTNGDTFINFWFMDGAIINGGINQQTSGIQANTFCGGHGNVVHQDAGGVGNTTQNDSHVQAPEYNSSCEGNEGNIKPTPKPVVPSARPVVPTPKPVVPSARPVVPTPKPVVPSARPVVPTPKPVVPSARPIVPTPKPVVPSARPVVPTPKPVVPSARPIDISIGLTSDDEVLYIGEAESSYSSLTNIYVKVFENGHQIKDPDVVFKTSNSIGTLSSNKLQNGKNYVTLYAKAEGQIEIVATYRGVSASIKIQIIKLVEVPEVSQVPEVSKTQASIERVLMTVGDEAAMDLNVRLPGFSGDANKLLVLPNGVEKDGPGLVAFGDGLYVGQFVIDHSLIGKTITILVVDTDKMIGTSINLVVQNMDWQA